MIITIDHLLETFLKLTWTTWTTWSTWTAWISLTDFNTNTPPTRPRTGAHLPTPDPVRALQHARQCVGVGVAG